MTDPSDPLQANRDQQRLPEQGAQAGPDITAYPLGDLPAEVQRLVQELQVHQVEPQLQHEELQASQLATEAARAKYAELYDFAPAVLFTWSHQTRNGK